MTDAIKVLVGKYEDANKEYQTQLLNAIKIPLMVYREGLYKIIR